MTLQMSAGKLVYRSAKQKCNDSHVLPREFKMDLGQNIEQHPSVTAGYRVPGSNTCYPSLCCPFLYILHSEGARYEVAFND